MSHDNFIQMDFDVTRFSDLLNYSPKDDIYL